MLKFQLERVFKVLRGDKNTKQKIEDHYFVWHIIKLNYNQTYFILKHLWKILKQLLIMGLKPKLSNCQTIKNVSNLQKKIWLSLFLINTNSKTSEFGGIRWPI